VTLADVSGQGECFVFHFSKNCLTGYVSLRGTPTGTKYGRLVGSLLLWSGSGQQGLIKVDFVDIRVSGVSFEGALGNKTVALGIEK
jgi:hypothetical protein